MCHSVDKRAANRTKEITERGLTNCGLKNFQTKKISLEFVLVLCVGCELGGEISCIYYSQQISYFIQQIIELKEKEVLK